MPDSPRESLDELLAPLTLHTHAGSLSTLATDFSAAYHRLALESTDQFLPTPITALPDGREKGQFLTLDMGGTNLRVAVVELYGSSSTTTTTPTAATDPYRSSRLQISPQATWEVPQDLKTSSAEALFDWVAARIVEVLEMYLPTAPPSVQEGIARGGVNLGVTFSFPMVQSSHTSAILQPMGKGFSLGDSAEGTGAGGGGYDLKVLLEEGYERHRRGNVGEGQGARGFGPSTLPRLNVVAITNDSISTLLAGGYVHSGNSSVGIITGTGTNATCLCPVGKLASFKKPEVGGCTHVLLNTEWSINGTRPPLERFITRWDRELDAGNEKPGFQPLEEMMGGRYLGELVRLVARDVFESDGGTLPGRFCGPYRVETKICSLVEAVAEEEEGGVEKLVGLLAEYFRDGEEEEEGGQGGWRWEERNRTSIFRRICSAVSERAAALVAAATVGILEVNDDLQLSRDEQQEGQAELPDLVVSYTGTVMEKYSGFRERCQAFIDRLVEEKYEGIEQEGDVRRRRRRGVQLVESFEGGVVGAAVLAAMVLEGRT